MNISNSMLEKLNIGIWQLTSLYSHYDTFVVSILTKIHVNFQ